MSAEPPPKPTHRVFVKRGLEGQDEEIDILQVYFKELQAATVETSVDPDLDLLTFASVAHYFGVVMLEEIEVDSSSCSKPTAADLDPDADGEPEDDSIDADLEDFISSPPISPPESNSSGGSAGVASTSPDEKNAPGVFRAISKDEFLALPEQERVMKWREAFHATINGECEGEDDDDDDGTALSSFAPALYHRYRQLRDDVNAGVTGAHETNIEDNLSHLRQPQQPSGAKGQGNPEDFINWPEDAPSTSAHQGPPSTPGYASSEAEESDLSSIYAHKPLELDDNLGREYLQPELYTTPAPDPVDIPQDPELQKVIMDSALRYRDELRARRVQEYEASLARKRNPSGWPKAHTTTPPPLPTRKVSKPIGLTYLATSQYFQDPLHIGECNIGVYIAPDFREKEGIPEALDEVVEIAFRDRDCHRLQAIVVENQDTWHSLNLLTTAGFRQEGIRRRAFYSPIAREWKDVTYFAILATEWVYDRSNSPTSSIHIRPKSLWDEVITRHQRERDELIRLHEKECNSGRLKRSNSMETIRENTPTVDYCISDSASASGFATDSSVDPEPYSPGKRRRVEASSASSSQASWSRPSSSASFIQEQDPFLSDDSDWELPTFGNPLRFISSIRKSQDASAGPSNPRKRTSISSASSSASSQWDMMDG